MSPRLLTVLVAALPALVFGLPAAAQAPARPAAQPLAEPAPLVNEPAIRRSVVEDDGARIQELRVRGQVQSITVQPKGPLKTPYEVLPIDVGRDPTDGPNSSKGAAGKRVWRVLSF